MDKSLIEYLQLLSELDIYPLIRDLLRAMGYEQVNITHGPVEIGKDIVFLESDQIGRRIWRGIQVKKDPLTGSLATDKGARGIIIQCEASLDTPYTEPNGQEVTLSEVWIVTPHPVSEYTKLSIKGRLQKESKVHIIDGPNLCDLIEKYIPDLVEAGSKPIEKYLKNLMAFCDSPEEYLSSKMRMTYSISDVFINPMVAIEILKQDSFSEREQLCRIQECDALGQTMESFIPLFGEGLLPSVEFYLVSERIKQLTRLSKAITSMSWYKGDRGLFDSSVQSLVSTIGFDGLDEQALRAQCSSRSLASRINQDILEKIEEQLCDLSNDEIEILKRYSNLKKIRPHSTWEKSDPLKEEQWFKVKFGRGQFFSRLLEAYGTHINLLSSMTQIVIEASKLIYLNEITDKGQYKRDIDIAYNLIANMSLFLDHFDLAIRQHYEMLWLKVPADLSKTGYISFDDPQLFQVITELGHLTSFINAFYGRRDERDYIKINFDAFALTSNVHRVIFRGALGMGKTTLLKRLCHEMARKMRDDPSQKLPVLSFLSAAQDERHIKVTKIVADGAREAFHSLENVSVEEINWVLDGFDEIESPSLRERIIEWCTAEESSKTNIILSSRSSALPSHIPGLTLIDLLPFNRDQIRTFIGQFPWRGSSESDLLLITLDDNPALFALAQSPLMLTLITILSQHIGPDRLPRRREELYRVLVKLLLGDWDLSKGVQRPQSIPEVDLRLGIIRRVAYSLYLMRKRSFTKNEFVALAIDAMSGRCISQQTALDFFEDLIRDCILIPLSMYEFGFFHFSIQEFLAAEDLAQDINPDRVVCAIQEYFRSDGWWEETLVFYAGIKRDVTVLINDLHKNLTAKIVTSDVPNDTLARLLIRWLDVADFTKIDRLNPRGTVAMTLSKLDIGDGAILWEKYGRIQD